MKTQPPFSSADSCLTHQELPFYSHRVGWGDTPETGEGVFHLLPGEVGVAMGGVAIAEEPSRRAATRWVCQQAGFLYWVPGLCPRSQSTSNQRLRE